MLLMSSGRFDPSSSDGVWSGAFSDRVTQRSPHYSLAQSLGASNKGNYGSNSGGLTFVSPIGMSSGGKIAMEIEKLAESKSTGRCAAVSREAIEQALGISIPRTNSAKDYGPKLEAVGFREVTDGQNRPGDVRVIQSIEGHPHGHMQIYTNKGWMSDFKQRDEWPGEAYRNAKPNYKQYRLGD
ncbi:unnamed protein product [Didymodactylos carnosus]|uniref:Uncharacterized protein n=1 Tax=Didymodactylos carnosus TaxID=1234261 RepID=A0A814BN09_9BILA|nr:unnamed protein product [Didymodactylos carnosus]CAF3707859.1 unnamed protein product [Didymodactylos carnosus]